MALLGTGRAGGATVKLIVDDREYTAKLIGAERTLNRSTGRMNHDLERLTRGTLAGSGAFRHLGRSIAFASGAFLGAAGFTSLVRQSISAASDLHEQINKVNVVFRGSQKSVLEWSHTTAKSIGIARGEALGFAATFGNLLVPMGLTRQAASTMSVQFVKLAADLASFNNADPSEVLQALQSGLAGQIRPLRQYGIFIDQTRIKAEALRLGLLQGKADAKQVEIANEGLAIAQAKYNQALKDYGPNTTQVVTAHKALLTAQTGLEKATSGVTGQLTQQQKVLAIHAIIMRDSRDAQGDFARTSGGLANQQRIMRAQIKNTEEEIGKQLLPTTLKIVTAVNDWLGKSKNQATIQRTLNTVIRTASGLLGALKDTAETMAPIVQTLNKALGGTVNSFKLLFALSVAAKLRGIGLALGLTSGGLAAEATTAGVRVGRLRLALLALSRLVVPVIAIEVLLNYKTVGGIIGDTIDKIAGVPTTPGAAANVPATTGVVADGIRAMARRGLNPRQIQAELKRRFGINVTLAQIQAALQGDKAGSAAAGAAEKAANKAAVAGATPAQQALVATATQFGPGSGITYTWGGTSPQTGFDCSGFLQYVYAKHGIRIPHNTVAQFHDPNAINSTGDEAPGDGVYFRTSGPGSAPQHVGFYLGNGRFIEYFSRGKPAKYNTIAAKGGYMGARRWLKVAAQTGGDTGAKGSPGTGAAPAAPGAPLTVGKKTSASTKGLIPDVLQERLAKAELTPGIRDDIAALSAIEKWLDDRIKKTRNIKEKVKLLKALGSVRKQLGALQEKLPLGQRPVGGFVQVGGAPGGEGIPGAGFIGAGQAAISEAEKTRTGGAQQTLDIPGLGKVLIGTEQKPTVEAIDKQIALLIAKGKAAVSRRAAKQAAVTKLSRVKSRVGRTARLKMIARLKKEIAQLTKLINDIREELGALYSTRAGLVEEMASAAEAAAQEPETGAGASDTAGAGDVGGGLAAGITDLPQGMRLGAAEASLTPDTADDVFFARQTVGLYQSRLATTSDPEQRIELISALQSARQSLASASTAVPLNWQLEAAQARLTPSQLDDRAVTQKILDMTKARLKEAQTIEEQIALTNQLVDLKSQVNQQQAEENGQLIAFLNARREIARTYASNVIGPALGGAQITIQNFNQPTPQDPHSWSSQVQFELKALVS